jgi:hypothetical protein
METGVPRPGTRTAGYGRRLAGHERAGGRVHGEDEDGVESLVGHDDETAAWVEHDVVRMRRRLLGAVWTERALERHQIGERRQ